MNFKSILSKPKSVLNLYKETKKNCWVNPGHFYSPVVDIESYKADNNASWKGPEQLDGIDLNLDSQKSLAKEFEQYYNDIQFKDTKQSDSRYYFKNDYYSYSDAIVLHSIIRHYKPKNIIEVGSGFSSAVMLDTRDTFKLDNNISFIEPYPDRLKSLLTEKDYSSVTIHESFVQDVSLNEFSKLDKGDILLIDSTHISKTNSDVNYILFKILPKLKPGVLIHFHDVFTSFEYPESWILEGRSWNEDYILRAFLMNNSKYLIKFFTHHLHMHHSEVFENMPLCYNNFGANIWLEKC